MKDLNIKLKLFICPHNKSFLKVTLWRMRKNTEGAEYRFHSKELTNAAGGYPQNTSPA